MHGVGHQLGGFPITWGARIVFAATIFAHERRCCFGVIWTRDLGASVGGEVVWHAGRFEKRQDAASTFGEAPFLRGHFTTGRGRFSRQEMATEDQADGEVTCFGAGVEDFFRPYRLTALHLDRVPATRGK
jgi:hypothetical protein